MNVVVVDFLVGVLVDENNVGYFLVIVLGVVWFFWDLGFYYDYQMEWWYYIGNLEIVDGWFFGYQFIFFCRVFVLFGEGVVIVDVFLWCMIQVYMVYFVISDILNRGFYLVEKFSWQVLGLVGVSLELYVVWLDDWYVCEFNNNLV